ncbi:MAG: c-type cytochrome [Minwuia sp.]|uniref:c-type cytochrome n=1 Tax=Minwuia sp. TaxID=2493630 RepID=UPI003A890FD4
MDSMFFNKIAGAVLLTVLVGYAIAKLSHGLISPHGPETVAYPVPEFESSAVADAGATEEVETPIAVVLASADAAKGERVFKKCAACHTLEDGGANKVGPNLYGIVDRDIGSVGGFEYSATLAELEGDWTYDNLSKFLADPKGWANGTKMAFAGLKKDSERGDVILYMKSFGDADTPLPEPEAPAAESESSPAAETESQPASE